MTQDIFDYLNHLDQERFRTAIIHTKPLKGPALTSFCQKCCKNANGKYLDFLEFFIQNPNLCEIIDRFGPEKLREILIEESKGQSLLMIDRPDFLLDTWRRSERFDFYRFINNQWDGYRDGMKAKIIFALQTSSDLETQIIRDSQGNSRIFELSDFQNIV